MTRIFNILLITCFTISLSFASKLETKTSLHELYTTISTESEQGGGNADTHMVSSYFKYTNNKWRIGGLVEAYNVTSKRDSKHNNEASSFTLVNIDSLYANYKINDRLTTTIGLLSLRTDTGTISSIPIDIRNNVNPLLTNFVANGIAANYKFDSMHKISLSLLDNGNTLDPMLIKSKYIRDRIYDSYTGLNLKMVGESDVRKDIIDFMHFKTKTLDGHKYDQSNLGFYFMISDLLKSDVVYTYNVSLSNISDGKDVYLNGYACSTSVSDIVTIPTFNRDLTLAAEFVYIDKDYVSLNTGKFLSPYSMQNSGVTFISYFNLDITNRLFVRLRSSYTKTDHYMRRMGYTDMRPIKSDDMSDTVTNMLELSYTF